MSDTHEDRVRAARSYLATVPLMEQLMAQTVNNIAGLTADQRTRVTAALRARSEALEGAMLEAIAEIMTAPELEAMARFFASREGQSYLKKLPLVMADVQNRFGPVLRAAIDEELKR